MTTICPKCNYARKQTDTCPSWQCPSCQVVYSKFGDTQVAMDGKDRSSSSHFRPAPEESGSSWKWVVALVLIVGVAWQGRAMYKRQAPQSAYQGSMQSRSSQPQPEVIMYSASWCGYCKASREFFKDHRVRFTELDIENTAEGAEAYEKLGRGGIPLIFVGGEEIRGFDESELRRRLRPWMKEA
ncbi:MAG: glutaredoxin family protein [Betaproteobacteria bacterium]